MPRIALLAASSSHPKRRPPVFLLYVQAIIREFRGTLIALTIIVCIGALLNLLAPPECFDGHKAGVFKAVYGAWMALFAQPIGSPAECWYLTVMDAVYPLAGFIVLGEGVVRLAMLLTSRKHGEKEWMRVMASTYRDHVVLCGLGHLGIRVLQELLAAKVPVVAIEKDANGAFLGQARATHCPILIRDMNEDQALLDAGIEEARAIIIATNNDLANVEVALDARRMNPRVQIIMRMFEQRIAEKISGALSIDMAFSASALAAPVVAAMAMDAHILGSYLIGNVQHVTAQIRVRPQSSLCGRALTELEQSFSAKVLSHQRGPSSAPSRSDEIAPEDTLVLHLPAASLTELSTLAREAGGATSSAA